LRSIIGRPASTLVTTHTVNRIPRTTARHRGRRRSVLLAAVLLVLCGSLGSAQEPPPGAPAPEQVQPPAEPVPFQVVVLVSCYGAMDTVSMCFPSPVDHGEVAEIVKRMGELGGWEAVDLEIEDDWFVPVWRQIEGEKPQGELQTFVEFGADGVINHDERWIALDPFIVALKRYSPMRLVLALADEVTVTGPGDFEDNTVRIRYNEEQGSIVYDITVKDPDLASTGVPAHPPEPPPAVPPAPPTPPRRWPLLAIIVGALAATTAGGMVWLRRKGLWPGMAKDRDGELHGEHPESGAESGKRGEESGR